MEEEDGRAKVEGMVDECEVLKYQKVLLTWMRNESDNG